MYSYCTSVTTVAHFLQTRHQCKFIFKSNRHECRADTSGFLQKKTTVEKEDNCFSTKVQFGKAIGSYIQQIIYIFWQ